MAAESDWISTEEAGKVLGVSARTVRNYIALKILQYRRTLGVYRVLRSECAAMAPYSDPIQKARSLVALAKTYAAVAKFPPGRFNELLAALDGKDLEPASEKRETKRGSKADRDIDSILG